MGCSSQSPSFQISKMGISISFCVHMHPYTPRDTFQTYPRALNPPATSTLMHWDRPMSFCNSPCRSSAGECHGQYLLRESHMQSLGLMLLECPHLIWGQSWPLIRMKRNIPTKVKTLFSLQRSPDFQCRLGRVSSLPFLSKP